MRIGDALHQARQQLEAAGVPDALREAELLLAACLRRERVRGEPLAYITHRRWFYGIEFYVARGVLIPRPETELLVEVFLCWARGYANGGVLVDAGTGSGCVAAACLLNAPCWQGIGIDRSRRALRIAMRNRARLGLSDRWLLLQGDWLTALCPLSTDAVLANPPYILPQEWAHLEPEITHYEPKRALLLPRADPLRPYRQLIRQASVVLKPGGLLALETSPTLVEAVHTMLVQHGYREIQVQADLAGHPRVVSALRQAIG